MSDDEVLTLKDRELLGDLALRSECFAETSDALLEASQELASLVRRCPEFEQQAFSRLCANMRQLSDAEGELGKEVMRFSHLWEDEMEAARSP